MGQLFTIGYANKSMDLFIDLLKENKVNCLVDVRTMPYSKQFPNYNENKLSNTLKEHGIIYMPFKNEFGARRSENDVYELVSYPDSTNNEVVIFEKVWQTEEFKKGVERIKNGLNKGYNICFMCSEKYPFECHRDIMVSEYFRRYENIEVNHIFSSKEVHNQSFYDDEIEKIFNEQKNKFYKKYSKELDYGGNFFENKVDERIQKWDDFFSNYTKEKGYYLQNLLIGYKKGADTND